MAEGGVPYPSVFMVDSHATYPPLPPKPRPPGRGGVAQSLLFLLVGLALCGLAIEACFIYHLYSKQGSVESGSAGMSIQDQEDIPKDVPPTSRPNPIVLPSKPVAHLTAGPQAPHGDGVMVWNMQAEPLLHEMEYKDGKLVIQKQGYYYVYSKIFFSEVNVAFTHSVCRTTPRYLGKDIELLKSRRYYPKFGKIMSTSNSYLGGVFHFFEDDSIFVKVKNVTQVRIQYSTENVFGIYMI
ncbi:tumor necrosis factor ligand superfamily member 14 [Salvelinus sp. IW2-2015]|uniref:tumor necrosis factor ligand superfamily member 14 n=1 Tax=Salvelinus sp. IW2-2015 TaxID=2691554 RepID=UPI000CDF70C7|nr:tumor necrosis factor ligand superfamily member 14 [Salvelinus alpinus]